MTRKTPIQQNKRNLIDSPFSAARSVAGDGGRAVPVFAFGKLLCNNGWLVRKGRLVKQSFNENGKCPDRKMRWGESAKKGWTLMVSSSQPPGELQAAWGKETWWLMF